MGRLVASWAKLSDADYKAQNLLNGKLIGGSAQLTLTAFIPAALCTWDLLGDDPVGFRLNVSFVLVAADSRHRKRGQRSHDLICHWENSIPRARLNAVHAGETPESRQHTDSPLRQLAAIVS